MPRLFTVAALGLAWLLAGCQTTTVPRATYDNIVAQARNATESKPVADVPDSAVADALLPPAARLAELLPKARPALEERFNVNFNNVPAIQLFNSLVAGTRFNMLIHPEVTGSVSANLKDVTLVEALDAVRELYGYEYRIDGTRIYIRPLTMQTRMFQVNYLNGSRKGSSNLHVASTSVSSVGTSTTGQSGSNGQGAPTPQPGQPGQPGQSGSGQGQDSTNVSTSTSSDFWADLKQALEAIVGSNKDGRSVVISPQSGVLVVRAMPDELRSVDQYLRATQLSVERQVILEAKILEVELNDSFQSGVNWAAFGKHIAGGMVSPGTTLLPMTASGVAPVISSGGTAGITGAAAAALGAAANATGSLFGVAFQTANFASLISFLESQGTVHVLSSPRIATLNNQKAVLKIGTDEFFVTGISTTTNNNNSNGGNGTTTPSLTLTPFFSGVVLDVTPQIDDHGNIILHVHPSVSQVSTINKGINLGTLGNFNLPLAASATSEMDSMVRGLDGHVVAIGGLMRQASTGDRAQLPGLGSVPVLGALLGSTRQVNQKRELVVLIKPTIVEGASDWSQNMLDVSRRFKELDPRNGAGRN